MSHPPVGAATQAVLDRYQRDLASHRRRALATRGVTALLVAWTLVGVVVLPGVAMMNHWTLPWYVSVSPVPLLIIWLLLRWRLADALGSRGTPPFPNQLLAIAAEQDEQAAHPRAFGSTPASMRVYHPEHR